MLNEEEIRKAISLLIGDGKLFECRIVYPHKKTQPSGYFKSSDDLIAQLRNMRLTNANVYIVLNAIKPECYGREQADHFVDGASTTSDNDIIVRDWILIDLDAVRPSGTSATDEQIKIAHDKAGKVYKYLQTQGFSEPIVAFSGNGYHLLYRIKLLNNQVNKDLLKRFLEALDIMFSDECVQVDTSVYNAGRICKLYGTMAQKGRSTETQPHRMSQITYVPNEILHVEPQYIEKIANSIVTERIQANRYNNYNASNFDLENWMTEHGIQYRITGYSGGQKYILDHCPFDHTHKGKDAVIFKLANGAIGFKCFHNSCSDKTWRDVRLLYEPDAYSREWKRQDRTMYKTHNRDEKPPVQKIVQRENEPIFLTAKQILNKPKPPQSFIKTGVKEIDKKMRGLKKGDVSVWSGLRGSAKSTLLSQIALNAVDTGNVVIFYSGELVCFDFMHWMNLQAAGNHNQPAFHEGYFNTPAEFQSAIADWLEGKFYLYNNDYGNGFEAVIAEVEKQIEEHKADIVFLDNLMAFNISSLASTKWEAQTAFVWKLHELANKSHTHIAFVAHPRKSSGFLRFDDISGTADIGNAVDSAFIVHRNNEDFKRLSAEMFKWKADSDVYKGTNVVEIVKDRGGGNQDVFIPLYYDARSKRLRNSEDEYVVYGWEEPDEDGFIDLPDDIPFEEL